jgi:3-hydroxyacyl-[acyl-carrier-protein] dehydratase
MGMIDQEGIKALIPHRPPFLLVDEVLSYDENQLTARRSVRADEPYFEGHYPGNPIMPGVLISEAIFQAASVYMAKRLEREGTDFTKATPVLARIIDARFKQMVKPGDVLDLEVTYKEALSRFHFMRGAAKRGGKVVATVEFALAMVTES